MIKKARLLHSAIGYKVAKSVAKNSKNIKRSMYSYSALFNGKNKIVRKYINIFSLIAINVSSVS